MREQEWGPLLERPAWARSGRRQGLERVLAGRSERLFLLAAVWAEFGPSSEGWSGWVTPGSQEWAR